MSLESDTYKTIEIAKGDVLFKEKGSKFIGYAFPITSEDEAKIYIDELKKKHHSARHWCYAWQIGVEDVQYRANDDGEPNNSAGQPIYGQILSKEVTNILVVVVRYFGGTKLGVGGLITAYKTSAKMILDEVDIVEKTIDVFFQLIFEYADMNKVMRIVKEQNLDLIEQKMALNCDFLIAVRKKNAQKVKDLILDLRCVKLKEVTP
ncbi:YigZ family protein [Lutibacter sp. HS1-25]|uniref:IMPACT family protein n=1 Tax=Lutibacter sp. HS1-25 TaxID=2485000 RepID=UPI00101315AF|nr:YigZ family protein [Lutibacter sp. HS1-25]RXP63516.1 YigZ family protein [Lutibacter sp. HS1-25]